jgi:hypothetical protein
MKWSVQRDKKEQTFEELFERTVMPIWDYGKEDRLLIREMFNC